ncbi:PRC-barrel domain-containing protein [Microvirga arabica]|uniref:PRC-barrel domain-containing protein n=1 Tax=Microvirga arabica TaxID=1128671 RepID=A0ABV6Y9Z0_9HYPH|nr:PRC-barrel domain-containing protein [Microvirga arabica]MBM1173751.1 PRC-barrel domain-containing protein [Microvirga arabica]
MLKMKLAAGLAAAALLAGPSFAQTTAPTQPAGPGQVMTQMPQDLMRGSQLMGIDVYGADNQKIGDIDEVLVDRQGKIHGLVVGVGGFLGIGQKDVAIPFDQVQWMSNQEVQASSGTATQGNSGTNTAGGVTVPSTATSRTNQPATTGSTAAGTTGSPGAAGTLGGAGTGGTTAGTGTAAAGTDPNMPARAMVKMTKADLQNAPEFRYANDQNRASAAGNTTPPPRNVNTPGNTPPNAPQQ